MLCKITYIQYAIQPIHIFISEKFHSDEINGSESPLLFHSWAPTHHNFTFNLFLYELNHKVHLSKTVCGIFHFWFCFLFIKVYILVQQSAWTLWFYNVITPFKMKIIEKPHTVLIPAVWFLSYNKFQNSKISACCELELPKTDLVTNFLNPENWSF